MIVWKFSSLYLTFNRPIDTTPNKTTLTVGSLEQVNFSLFELMGLILVRMAGTRSYHVVGVPRVFSGALGSGPI